MENLKELEKFLSQREIFLKPWGWKNSKNNI